MTSKHLPSTLMAILNDAAHKQADVSLILTADAFELFTAWARAEGLELEDFLSGYLERQAQEHLDAMSDQDRLFVAASPLNRPER